VSAGKGDGPAMNRRTFIQAAATTVSGLTARVGTSQTDRSVEGLLKWLEESRREEIPRDVARMIRSGLRHEDLLAALSLATVRNVQPYPDVGYKYHAVMVLRSVHLATAQLPSADRWLPIVWAADYFKDAQAQERGASGWRLPPRPVAAVGDREAARRALVTALDNWDREAADAAIARYAQSAPVEEIFPLLFAYGARDLRAIGHKAITVSNAHSLVPFLGSAEAVPLLRSTVAALQNGEGGPDPARHNLQPDRPWRQNQQQLHRIPPTWKQGRDDVGARRELRAALYQASEDAAGTAVVESLRQGMSPQAAWQVLFATAAELLAHQPSIVLVHAQTTANALHYAYRFCSDPQVQQLMLLQCAAFIAMFRRLTNATEPDFSLDALEPLPLESTGAAAIAEIFHDVSTGHRLQAARKCLGYLQTGGDAVAVIATARHNLAYNAEEAHDYKFSEAVFDNCSQFADSAGRNRFLSAGMAYFKGPAKRPTPVVEEMVELLRG
jgi:hypothetical protein